MECIPLKKEEKKSGYKFGVFHQWILSPSSYIFGLEILINFDFFSPELITELIYYYL